MAHRGGAARAPGRPLPGGGVHAAEGHVPIGEDRFYPFLHVLHLATHQERARDLLPRAGRAAGERFFRPHLWPNTPDILPGQLQTGGRPAFLAWFVLAATLSSNYGIYGPVFELAENRPTGPGHEEYLDSEKYEVRHWDLDAVQSLAPFIRRVNLIRKANPALLQVQGLTFHGVSNPSLVAYSRATRDRSNVLLVVVNLDPRNPQSGMTDLDLEALGVPPGERFQVDDLLSERRFLWHGPSNYVELRPHEMPAHIFLIRRLVHRADGTEAFD